MKTENPANKKEFLIYTIKEMPKDVCIKTKFRPKTYQRLVQLAMHPERGNDTLCLVHTTGVGKCVHPTTKVTCMFEDNRVSRVTIEELFELASKHGRMYLDTNPEISELVTGNAFWLKLDKPIYIESRDGFLPISKLYKQFVFGEEIIEVELHNGMKIAGTGNHKLFIRELNDYIPLKHIRKMYKFTLMTCLTTSGWSYITMVNRFVYTGSVYDVEVSDDTHCYFANGILTHNTCSSVLISKMHRRDIINFNKQGIHSRIYIVSDKAAKYNFINELTGDCNDNEYQVPDDITDPKKRMKEILKMLTNPKYDGYYTFLTYSKLNNDVKNGKLTNINNSLMIIDEAHHLVNPYKWNESILKLFDNSTNYKLVFLTATPVFNNVEQFVNFVNLIVKKNDRITASDIFDDKMEITEDGIKLLKRILKNKISYVADKNKYAYPRKIEVGEIPTTIDPETGGRIEKTHLVRCEMSDYHYKVYKKYWTGKMHPSIKPLIDMVIPTPDESKIGIFTHKDIESSVSAEINRPFYDKLGISYFRDSSKNLVLSGDFLHIDKIGEYNTKLRKLLTFLINEIGLHFVFNNFVNNTGVKMIGECLSVNGFLEYSKTHLDELENTDFDFIANYKNIRCYKCGKFGREHSGTKKDSHRFIPARYILTYDDVKEETRNELYSTFTREDNADGEIIKIIIGGPVTREILNLKRVNHIHIMNYQENTARQIQIEGRGIRQCGHYDMPPERQFVKIYRYVSVIPNEMNKNNEMSAEEIEYYKNEIEYNRIQKIMKILNLISFDCYMNATINEIDRDLCFYKYRKKSEIDDSDYETKYGDVELSRTMEYIYDAFGDSVSFTYDQLSREIDRMSDNLESLTISRKYKLLALDKMIKDKIPVKNPNGHLGVIEFIDGYYTFRPIDAPPNAKLIDVNDRMILNSSSTDGMLEKINVTNIIKKAVKEKKEERKQKVSIPKLLTSIDEAIGKTTSFNAIKKNLIVQPLKTQIAIVEECMKEYFITYCKKARNRPVVIKILEIYRDLLINSEQIVVNTDYSYQHTIYDTFEDKLISDKLIPIGHFIDRKPRTIVNYKELLQRKDPNSQIVFDYYVGLFTERLQLLKDRVDNDIMGYIDKDQKNNTMFKIKEIGKRNGFVCIQNNNKKVLVDIARKLDIAIDSSAKKEVICNAIQSKLRDLQNKANKEGKKINYFLDYLDVYTIGLNKYFLETTIEAK